MILPTLNEAGNIVAQIREIYRVLPDIGEIIVVDDDSQDETRSLVNNTFKDAISSHRLKLIHRTKNLGLTNSLREAVQSTSLPLVGWMDCDLSMPAEIIIQLLDAVSAGGDLALGSRFLAGGSQKSLSQVGKDSRSEIVLSTMLNKALSFITGVPCTDFTSGFIVIRKSWLDQFKWRGSHGEYFIHLVCDAHRSKKKIVEVPYQCGSRQFGESKTFGNWQATFKNTYRYSNTLLKVMREKISGI